MLCMASTISTVLLLLLLLGARERPGPVIIIRHAEYRFQSHRIVRQITVGGARRTNRLARTKRRSSSWHKKMMPQPCLTRKAQKEGTTAAAAGLRLRYSKGVKEIAPFSDGPLAIYFTASTLTRARLELGVKFPLRPSIQFQRASRPLLKCPK